MLDLVNGHVIVGSVPIAIQIVSSDPLTGTNGQIIVNSTENKIKVYYNSVWNELGITITPGEAVVPETGTPFGAWLGLWRTYTIE